MATATEVDLEIATLLKSEAFSIVFHPVLHIASRMMLGTEALARFDTGPGRTTLDWFTAAGRAGMRPNLEILAIRKALSWFRHLPDDACLFVNASPETVTHPAFTAVIPDDMIARLIIEVSADEPVSDIGALVGAVDELRERGGRLAIDDAGGVRTSLASLAELEPEVIKLGPSVTRGLPGSSSARAIARGLVAFARELGADVVAEAIETDAQLAALVDLGVEYGQGYLFGMPAALA